MSMLIIKPEDVFAMFERRLDNDRMNFDRVKNKFLKLVNKNLKSGYVTTHWGRYYMERPMRSAVTEELNKNGWHAEWDTINKTLTLSPLDNRLNQRFEEYARTLKELSIP